ncbi:hypothetical protein CPB84DRAFT_1791185 [Gymnopilus junonius]|uniref:Uncharacterized protein n=1 Tax=Gymnopilus junonius TaxID=109634 RepID=A0A9P5NFL9_GYMJU|nr:hypothetical protein CPB84DRAFT_1791185 [Gymnopilus junonius]
MRNYAKFLRSLSKVVRHLSDPRGSDFQKTDIEAGLGNLSLSSTIPILASKSDLEQGRQAVLFLLEALRKKSAETAWTIIRSAYRELSCDQSTVGMGTKAWLARSLCLEPVLHLSGSRESPSAEVDVDVESWLEARVPVGHVRRKEGVEGRWIVCKVR